MNPTREAAIAEFLAPESNKRRAYELSRLAERFEAVEKITQPFTKDRNKALSQVKWRLRGLDGQFVGLNSRVQCAFVPESEALTFDGRDNEIMKLRTYEAALGTLTLEQV